jgi:hypothetical protein
MNKNVLVGALSIVILIGIAFWFTQNRAVEEEVDTLAQDYISATYELDGETITLNTGDAAYFGNETFGDFNADGREDVAFLITREVEAGQRLFYAVAALNLEEGI